MRQNFLNAASGTNEDLIGSTFGLTYLLKLPRGMVFNQQAAYLPACNVPRAYSITESQLAGASRSTRVWAFPLERWTAT